MTNDQPETLPPPAILLQLMTGFQRAQAVYIAAKLGVADLLTDGPRPVEELAAATQSHPSSRYRYHSQAHPPGDAESGQAPGGRTGDPAGQ